MGFDAESVPQLDRDRRDKPGDDESAATSFASLTGTLWNGSTPRAFGTIYIVISRPRRGMATLSPSCARSRFNAPHSTA